MKVRFRRNVALSAVVLVLLVAAGCSSATTPSDTKNPPQEPAIPYTHVWSADPGIDLFSRGTELVRATYEAGTYTRYVGVDRSYPGYSQAVGAPVSWHNEDKMEPMVWSEVNNPVKPGRWTIYDHITNYSASNTRITADVCRYSVPSAEGKYDDSPWVLNDSTRIELSNTGISRGSGAPGIPDDNQEAHAANGHRSPSWNVFGTWQVTRIKRYDVDVNPDACVAWWLQQFPTFSRSPYGNFVTSPPGFQLPVHPVAVQYPEWIGPYEKPLTTTPAKPK